MITIRITKLAAKIASVMTLLLAASTAMAGMTPPTPGTIPEPGMLPLFGLGAVAMIAVAIRNHRNKK